MIDDSNVRELLGHFSSHHHCGHPDRPGSACPEPGLHEKLREALSPFDEDTIRDLWQRWFEEVRPSQSEWPMNEAIPITYMHLKDPSDGLSRTLLQFVFRPSPLPSGYCGHYYGPQASCFEGLCARRGLHWVHVESAFWWESGDAFLRRRLLTLVLQEGNPAFPQDRGLERGVFSPLWSAVIDTFLRETEESSLPLLQICMEAIVRLWPFDAKQAELLESCKRKAVESHDEQLRRQGNTMPDWPYLFSKQQR